VALCRAVIQRLHGPVIFLPGSFGGSGGFGGGGGGTLAAKCGSGGGGGAPVVADQNDYL